MCILSYCFLEIGLGHSEKAVIKGCCANTVLTSFKVKEQEIKSCCTCLTSLMNIPGAISTPSLEVI